MSTTEQLERKRLLPPYNPTLDAAIHRIFSASRQRGIKFGMPADHVAHPLSAAELRDLGAWFLTGVGDAALLLNAFKASVQAHS